MHFIFNLHTVFNLPFTIWTYLQLKNPIRESYHDEDNQGASCLFSLEDGAINNI